MRVGSAIEDVAVEADTIGIGVTRAIELRNAVDNRVPLIMRMRLRSVEQEKDISPKMKDGRQTLRLSPFLAAPNSHALNWGKVRTVEGVVGSSSALPEICSSKLSHVRSAELAKTTCNGPGL